MNWNNKDGIFISLMSGEPLFSSKDMFDSEMGWPCFVKSINGAPIKEVLYELRGVKRIKLIDDSTGADNFHLGILN